MPVTLVPRSREVIAFAAIRIKSPANWTVDLPEETADRSKRTNDGYFFKRETGCGGGRVPGFPFVSWPQAIVAMRDQAFFC